MCHFFCESHYKSHSLAPRKTRRSVYRRISSLEKKTMDLPFVNRKSRCKLKLTHPIPRFGAPHPTRTTSACPSLARASAVGRNARALADRNWDLATKAKAERKAIIVQILVENVCMMVSKDYIEENVAIFLTFSGCNLICQIMCVSGRGAPL
jgi:hypothetical protein